MHMSKMSAIRLLLVGATSLSSLAVAIPAVAQTTVASIRGRVTDSAGAPVAGATVTLTSAGTSRAQTTTTNAGGSYILNGVRAGTYRISVSDPAKGSFQRDIAVGVGTAATVDAQLSSATDTAEGGSTASADGDGAQIVVTGSRLRETRTSEIATNISQEQLRVLPQTDRNFLSFAALAPGVRYNDSETDKSFSSVASPASVASWSAITTRSAIRRSTSLRKSALSCVIFSTRSARASATRASRSAVRRSSSAPLSTPT